MSVVTAEQLQTNLGLNLFEYVNVMPALAGSTPPRTTTGTTMERPADIPALAPAYERELLHRVLQGPHGWMLRDIAAPGTTLSRVGIAIQWIRENFTSPLRVEALAAMAALSVSACHRHFKAVMALSPLQYQKRIRLLHARSLLIAGEGNTTSVSSDVGYESPTQFRREYSRSFGLPPSKDSLQIVRSAHPTIGY